MGDIRIDAHGTLFDGRYPMMIESMVRDMAWEVGGQASSYVHENADQSFKHPTPYYETQITVEHQDLDVVVHDRGIVYGPWLERGRPSTRFRGYHLWERAATRTQREVASLIRPILDRYLARIRGG